MSIASTHQVSDQISCEVDILAYDQSECRSLLPCPPRPTNAMDVCVNVLGNIKIDDSFDQWNVQTTGYEVKNILLV